MAVIYRITNMANGKYYIGSAESFARRVWQHRYDLKRGVHKNPKLQAAWDKYGEDMFVFEVIEEIPADRNTFDIENTYLMKCVGNPDCYNINVDAYVPRLGIPHTEETKAKLSRNRKGKHAGEEHYRHGKVLSEEVRKKIGDTQRGKPKPPGRKVSEEGRAKIKANIEAGRSHMHWVGKKHTDESKAKMSLPVYVVKADGSITNYPSMTYMRDTLGVSIATIIRACKSGAAVRVGVLAGWKLSYTPHVEVNIPPEYAHLPRTRQLAKAQGAATYFTGEPCTHGHIAPRKTKGTCTECLKLESIKKPLHPKNNTL